MRAVIPDTMPLFLRISSTEWMEWAAAQSWDVAQSIRLAKLLPGLGVDLVDVSSGGNNSLQKIPVVTDGGVDTYYQARIAGRVRGALRESGSDLLVGAVGMISTAEMATAIVGGGADARPRRWPTWSSWPGSSCASPSSSCGRPASWASPSRGRISITGPRGRRAQECSRSSSGSRRGRAFSSPKSLGMVVHAL